MLDGPRNSFDRGGRMTRWRDDLVGKKFGERTIVGRDFSRKKQIYVFYQCSCGRKGSVKLCTLLDSLSLYCPSCSHMSHGCSSFALYKQWTQLIRNKSCGIPESWRDFSFFLSVVGGESVLDNTIRRLSTSRPYDENNFEVVPK
jgi:hypothetical protein